MKAIICGAGQVGHNIAVELAAEKIDVTVIDQSAELIQKIDSNMDVRAMVGHASQPDVLEAAGAADCDMLIAVTFADEVNMVACQVAKSLFDVPVKIARIRARSYLQPIWANLFSRDNLPIDVIISPEIEVARAIRRRLMVPGTFEMIPLADDKLRLIGVRCEEDCPLLHTPLNQLPTLFPNLHFVTVGVVRGDQAFVPKSDEQFQPGDEVYIVVETDHVSRAMSAFGHDELEARRIVIVGGGNIGLNLAEEIEAQFSGKLATLIERNRDRAELVAQTCTKTEVINGDALDSEILEEANISRAETIISVTNDDEVNILASLLAKRNGAKSSIALINTASYASLLGPLGIDVVVNPRAITVSTILQYIRRGRIRSVHSIRENFGEIIEAEALETSTLVGVPLGQLDLPEDVVIAAVVRGDEVQMASDELRVAVGDRVVLFAGKGAVKEIEKMFAVRLEFF